MVTKYGAARLGSTKPNGGSIPPRSTNRKEKDMTLYTVSGFGGVVSSYQANSMEEAIEKFLSTPYAAFQGPWVVLSVTNTKSGKTARRKVKVKVSIDQIVVY